MHDAVIISDIHLGSDVCQSKQLNHFLESLPPTRRLVLNGDVFDSWDFRRLKSGHFKVLSKIRSLSSSIEVVWIHGNHDGPCEIVSHLLGTTVHEQYCFDTGGKRVLCTHGDKFDDFIATYPLIVRAADWVYHQLQRLDSDFYWARLAKMSSKTFLKSVEKVREKAVRHMVRSGCDMICCGHTHMPESHGGVYFNSGCWTEKPPCYIIANDGELRVQRYEENSAGD